MYFLVKKRKQLIIQGKSEIIVVNVVLQEIQFPIANELVYLIS